LKAVIVRLLSVLLVGALVLPALRAVEARVRPFAAHEFRLGMPLSDFRRLERFAELGPSERLVCSDDAPPRFAALVSPAPELIEAGAIECALLPTSEDPPPGAGTMEMFGERVRANFLFFRREGERVPRLTQIMIVMDNSRFERIVTLFRRTYGDSPRVDVLGGILMSGASVSNIIYTWENPLSTIQLEMYAISVDRARATFLYRDSWEELLAVVRRLRFGG
jgi:hypothetical protein